MERREIAESALRHLCDRVGLTYTTENKPVEGAWFLDTITRGRVNIYQWSENVRTGGRGVSSPLGFYGQNLTHGEVYDRCWFADRILTELAGSHDDVLILTTGPLKTAWVHCLDERIRPIRGPSRAAPKKPDNGSPLNR